MSQLAVKNVAGNLSTPVRSIAGLEALPPGRFAFAATCLGERESMQVERRGATVALLFRGRSAGVEQTGRFELRGTHPSPRGRARAYRLCGTLSLHNSVLELNAVESLDDGSRKVWRAEADLDPTTPGAKRQRRSVIVKGTAYYFFNDGPRQTPLRLEVTIVLQPRGGRAVILPPGLTMSCRELQIPIDADGKVSFRSQDGVSFVVRGQVRDSKIELWIETAGALGCARKEVSGEL
ncbi:MAG: hypothetical protein HY903_12170 [Deltaproteobacteria bacterium]|nr:hypothetical protein [Deltaproteobacteria bacterium]